MSYLSSAGSGGSGGGGDKYVNEIVTGSGTIWTLDDIPVDDTKVSLYGGGSRLYPPTDYTISGANITTTSSYDAGQVLADYS